MNRKALALLLPVVMLLTMNIGGCPSNPYSVAVRGSDDFAAGIAQAMTAIDQVHQQGLMSSQEELNILNYMQFGNTLNKQFQTCVSAVHNASKKAAGYLTCANAVASGLKDPAELASIRVVNPQGQARITAIVQSVQAIVNALIASFGGTTTTSAIMPTTEWRLA